MELFSIISEDFFKPLTSVNKKIYLDCIKRIHTILEDKFEIERSYIIKNLQEYFEENAIEILEENEEVLINTKEKPSRVIRYLINCGWIESEVRNDYSTMISFKDEAINFVQTILNVENQKEIEYNASIYSIFNNLNSLFEDETCLQPYTLVIHKILEDKNELVTELKRLRNNIKKFIEKITIDKNLGEIFENINEFNNSNISDKFERLTTRDNISRYRRAILSNLDKINNDDDILRKIALEYQEINKEEDLNCALDEILGEIREIQNFFQYEYDIIINEIIHKNTEYRKKALDRAKFLYSGEQRSYVSHINFILKQFENDDINEILENDIISIFTNNYIDDTSFCPIRINKSKTAPVKLEILDEVSDEIRLKNREVLRKLQENLFNDTNVTKYLNEFLRDTHKRRASEIIFASKEDALRLFYIKNSCKNNRIPFLVTETLEHVIVSNYKFKDFYIERI